MELISVLVLAFAAWLLISSYNAKKRREALFKKYGDAECVFRSLMSTCSSRN